VCEPITLGILGAAGSFASSAMGASANNKAAIRQYKHDLAIREGNWNKDQSTYRNKIVDYQNEYGENSSAAGRAYAAEQARYNEMFESAAFQQQDMLTQLVQSQGQLGASEKLGKTAGRMNTAMLGAFGRNNAVLAANLASARNAIQQRNEDTRLQLQSANNKAWSQVAIAPTPGIAPLAPVMQKPDYFGLATGLIGAVGGGIMKNNAGKAPPGWNTPEGMKNGYNTDLSGITGNIGLPDWGGGTGGLHDWNNSFGYNSNLKIGRVNGYNLNVK
jgi:hypothetical protein